MLVEIITFAPTQFFNCRHCEFILDQAKVEGSKEFHADALETSLPAEMFAEYQTLSDWIILTARRYAGRVTFRVVDAASVEGVWKSLRYGVHRYPAFVIAGKDKLPGADLTQVETRIHWHLANQSAQV